MQQSQIVWLTTERIATLTFSARLTLTVQVIVHLYGAGLFRSCAIFMLLGGNMDIVGLLRKERAELMGKVNEVDAALTLLGGGNGARGKSPMPEKDRLRRSVAMKASWRKEGLHSTKRNKFS